MLKKTITYTDYNDEERTEDFYFNLTNAEISEMELTQEGGLKNLIEKIVASKDKVKIVELFKTIILKAYGVKSEDGKRFMKSEEISKAFTETEAYSKLYMELITDENASAAFVKGILPQELRKKVDEKQLTNNQ